MNRLEFIGLLAEIEREVGEARATLQKNWNYVLPYRHLERAQAMMRQALPAAAAYAVSSGESVLVEKE